MAKCQEGSVDVGTFVRLMGSTLALSSMSRVSLVARSVAAEIPTPLMMGKGDPRSKKGKIFKGSYGKSRPNPYKVRKAKRLAEQQDEQQPVEVPEPPKNLLTPAEYPVVVEGIAWEPN